MNKLIVIRTHCQTLNIIQLYHTFLHYTIHVSTLCNKINTLKTTQILT